MLGLSLVAVSAGHSPVGVCRFLLLQSTDCKCTDSGVCGTQTLECRLVDGAHGLGCSSACGIFQYQGLKPCALHLQVDS